MVNALKAVLEATSLSSRDRQKLTALVQTRAEASEAEKAQDADTEAVENAMMGAPDPAAYKGHSGGIIDVLNDMLETAETQLADARKKEMEAQNAFDLLKLSIEDETKNAEKNMAKAKKAKATAAESKATAGGELAVTNKDLEEDTTYL